MISRGREGKDWPMDTKFHLDGRDAQLSGLELMIMHYYVF